MNERSRREKQHEGRALRPKLRAIPVSSRIIAPDQFFSQHNIDQPKVQTRLMGRPLSVPECSPRENAEIVNY